MSQARVVRYLCALIAQDDPSLNINEAQHQYFHQISDVIDALWETLTGDKYKILQVGQRLNEAGQFVNEKDNAPRLNLNNLCFKLYDDVYLCDTKADERHHIVCYRPIGNHFKRFSPYLEGSTPIELDEALHENGMYSPIIKVLVKKETNKQLNFGPKRTGLYCGIIIYGVRMVSFITASRIFITSQIYLSNRNIQLRLTKA